MYCQFRFKVPASTGPRVGPGKKITNISNFTIYVEYGSNESDENLFRTKIKVNIDIIYSDFGAKVEYVKIYVSNRESVNLKYDTSKCVWLKL